MAGLPGSRAIVKVGPPLSASEPSFGSTLFMLPAPVKVQLPSELRLWPASVMTPEQFAGMFAASNVFSKRGDPQAEPRAAARRGFCLGRRAAPARRPHHRRPRPEFDLSGRRRGGRPGGALAG